MRHSSRDHMENQPSGWHTFNLRLARFGKAGSRHTVLPNSLLSGCLLPPRRDGM